MVGTGELVSLAGARNLGGAGTFVAAVETIIVPVTAPVPGYAPLIGTCKGRR